MGGERLSSTEVAFPQARVSEDGTISFPHRGDPPKLIPGYKQVPGDKYCFKPVLLPCTCRQVLWRKVCGGMIQKMHCTLFNIDVRLVDCMDCTDRKAP